MKLEAVRDCDRVVKGRHSFPLLCERESRGRSSRTARVRFNLRTHIVECVSVLRTISTTLHLAPFVIPRSPAETEHGYTFL